VESFDLKTAQVIEKFNKLNLYPANMFVTSPEVLQNAIWEIQQDLVKQVIFQ
jgi:excinuclease ABC subunit B